MLWKPTPQDQETAALEEQPESGDISHFFEPSYYLDILRRRVLAFAGPFIIVLAVGGPLVASRPAMYLAEGKILVESPQIPIELVRPTVTSLATERIQLVEQRIVTRDTLLALAEKFSVFGPRGSMSSGEVASLMRLRIQIKPAELRLTARPYERQATAFTVGFEHEQPVIALRVANELITMILSEDVRARTWTASETTRFLERETKKLEGELSEIETQIVELKRQSAEQRKQKAQATETQLEILKSELAQKSSIYSDTHPDVKSLRQRISAIERTIVPPKTNEGDPGIEALERQQTSLQKIIEAANQKLIDARLGESMERSQRSERLEIVEQPGLPSTPVRPNRPRLFAIVLGLAIAAGCALVFLLELRDDTIRRTSDIARHVIPQLVAIPFIETKAEARLRRRKQILAIAAVLVSVTTVATTAALLLPLPKPLMNLLATVRPAA
ncbi:MAG: sugar transporter [Bradyrhizobium sp.]|nr:sugar transporter [Bradyrhizobium sp.]